MMIDIANEMQHFKNALSFPTARGADMKVLDICCAPGGYTAAVLRHNPGCNAFAITLPTEQGGHPLHVDRKQLAGLQLLDVVSDSFLSLPSKHVSRKSPVCLNLDRIIY